MDGALLDCHGEEWASIGVRCHQGGTPSLNTTLNTSMHIAQLHTASMCIVRVSRSILVQNCDTECGLFIGSKEEISMKIV